jgi:hypothetical protein
VSRVIRGVVYAPRRREATKVRSCKGRASPPSLVCVCAFTKQTATNFTCISTVCIHIIYHLLSQFTHSGIHNGSRRSDTDEWRARAAGGAVEERRSRAEQVERRERYVMTEKISRRCTRHLSLHHHVPPKSHFISYNPPLTPPPSPHRTQPHLCRIHQLPASLLSPPRTSQNHQTSRMAPLRHQRLRIHL